jgi:hypothetical protein
MAEIEKNIDNHEADNAKSGLPPYKHCKNCGAELQGEYCHKCGQEATSKVLTVGGFVLAYLDNNFLWDPQFLKTLWTLISRPGRLTREYIAGKFASQEHPLKLNMFLLFIFVTLFVFFASGDKINESVSNLKSDERLFTALQFDLLQKDSEFIQKMQVSQRDTVILKAPLLLAEIYPQIVTNIQTKEDSQGEGFDKWVAVLPRVLIEDEIILADEEGCYHLNPEATNAKNYLELVYSVLQEMSRITSQYFPIFLLLTAPFLAFSLRLVQRKSRLPRINHFIFSLHYTAFLETLIIFIYLLYLTIEPSMDILEGIMMLGSCVYLTIAFRKVYAVNGWFKTIIKSLLTSLIYCGILLFIFFVIFIWACYILATNSDITI